MIKIKDILKERKRKLFTVKPTDNVITAIKKMDKNNIGSVWVVDGTDLIGIFTEKELVKCCADGIAFNSTIIKEVMEKHLIPVTPEESIHVSMLKMTKNKMRYLPIKNKKKLIGMVSIGDLVKKEIDVMQEEITTLQRYITQ